ncbi:MAG TPA: outer membrane beta-barrel protein [Oligoflexia bacterium]|nr:outer membrane beta-barrel protein [Oligoflexia bacterium]
MNFSAMKKIVVLSALALIFGATDASAQSKKKNTNTRPVYKSVDASNSDSDAFKGRPRTNEHELGAGLGLNYFSDFGFQARYAYRAMPEGFIEGVNDAFLIEGGVGMTFYGRVKSENVTGVHFFAAGRWDFTKDELWTFFGTLGLGYNATSIDTGDVKGGGIFPVVGVGALYEINSDWAVRADFSYHFLGLGMAYRF